MMLLHCFIASLTLCVRWAHWFSLGTLHVRSRLLLVSHHTVSTSHCVHITLCGQEEKKRKEAEEREAEEAERLAKEKEGKEKKKGGASTTAK
jgi:hypothetical protein